MSPPPIPTTSPSKPHALVSPIDVSKVRDEKGVKTLIKRLLDFHGWFHFMPGANGFGKQGVHDVLALKEGIFITVEAKFGYNKPSATQKSFAGQIIANDCYAFCVNEKNIDHFAAFLESFEVAKQHQMQGLEVPQAHGSRMLNAISVLTDLWADDRVEPVDLSA